jgi:hypothetical protein
MNWPATIAFGLTWLVLGARLLESRVPAAVRVRLTAWRPLARDRSVS